jgi:hypothetical protein
MVPAEVEKSTAAYLAWLTKRMGQFKGEQMRNSLKDWASLCRRDPVPLREGDIRASVGVFERDLLDRHIAIPQAAFEPFVTKGGWRVADRPVVGVDISGAVLFCKGVALLDNRVYIDCFRSSPFNWLENGWYVPPHIIGIRDFDITDRTCTVNPTEYQPLRQLSDERAYFLFNSNWGAGNFGHFIHDVLGQLIVYEHISKLRGQRLTPILVHPLRYPMQRRLFEALVCPLDDAIYLDDGPVAASLCFSSSQPFHHDNSMSFAAMRTMREGMARVAQEAAKGAEISPRVYIAREDSAKGDRQFFNMVEAEALFERYGFARVVISRLEVEEVANVFRNCQVVIGVHGAGLMNVLFSSAEKARLIELLDFPGSWSSIHSVVSACGLEAHRIPALAPTPESGGLPLIDLEKVQALLASLD